MEITTLSIIVSLILSIYYLEMIKVISGMQVNRLRHFIGICSIWLLNSVCAISIEYPLYKVGVIFLMTVAVGKLIFNKTSLSNVLFASIIYNVTGFVADLAGYYIFSFMGVSVIDVQSTVSLFVISNANLILVINIAILITKYIKDRYKNVSSLYSINIWNKYLLIALAILFVNIYLIAMYSVNKLIIEKFIGLMPITVFIVVLFAAYSQIMMRSKESQNNQLQYYLTTMSKLSNDIKQFKHDFSNVLISLYGLAEQKEWEALHHRLHELQGSNITQYASDIEAMVNIREPSLISLLAAKMYYAHQNQLNFFIEAPHLVNELPIEGTDFIRIMGILIDNALEAALQSEKREVGAVFLAFDDYFEITVINSISDENIEVAAIDKQGVSTRGLGRGTGLSSLTTILKNYQPVEWSTVVKDGKFMQCIGFACDLKEKELERTPTQI